MAFKSLIFLAIFLGCTAGALGLPLLGVCGYVAHYIIGPERQWWCSAISYLDIRYSLVLAIMTAAGAAMHWQKLRTPPPAFDRQEKLVLAFLGVVWLSLLIGETTVGHYESVDHPSVKLLKAVAFGLLLTHIVTNVKGLQTLFRVMTAATLFLALQAYWTPRSAFSGGRLEGVGGADFQDSNFLGAFLAGMLPIIAVQILRSGWPGRIFSLVTAVLAVNGIMLTRSRGTFVAMALSAVTVALLTPRRQRAIVYTGLILAGLGAYRLMDTGYVERISTIASSDEERDRSAESRIEIWIGGMRMMLDNPLGVGAGNFMQAIGRYMPVDPTRDAHNTFVRCAGELGVPGLLLLIVLLTSAAFKLREAFVRAEPLPAAEREAVQWIVLGLAGGLAAAVGSSLTMTFLYVEYFWWILLLPVCVSRAVVMRLAQLAGEEECPAADDAPALWPQSGAIG